MNPHKPGLANSLVAVRSACHLMRQALAAEADARGIEQASAAFPRALATWREAWRTASANERAAMKRDAAGVGAEISALREAVQRAAAGTQRALQTLLPQAAAAEVYSATGSRAAASPQGFLSA
jgi:hypothetical protein